MEKDEINEDQPLMQNQQTEYVTKAKHEELKQTFESQSLRIDALEKIIAPLNELAKSKKITVMEYIQGLEKETKTILTLKQELDKFQDEHKQNLKY